MNKDQAIKCFAEGTEVWYYNRTMTFAHKTIQGVEDQGCWMWDYSGSLKILVPFAELGMTEMEAKEAHYKHRIVDGPNDVVRHAKHFGMVVLTNEQYDQIKSATLPTPKPKRKPAVGDRWSVLGDTCVIVDINGIKAVNIYTGEFLDCDDETFIEHCIFQE